MKFSAKFSLFFLFVLLLGLVGLQSEGDGVGVTAVAAGSDHFVYLPFVIRQSNEPVPFGPLHTGEGTYYYATGAGNCGFDPSPQNMMVAAMNHVDYNNAAICGAYIQVDGPQGSVMVRIVDQCPGCPAGDVDLSVEAFAKIAPISAGRVPISWQLVSPPLDGPIQYYFKSDSHQYWMAMQMRNHRNPIAKFEYWNGSHFVEISRTSYNYYELQSPPPGPFTFRVTDLLGNVLVDSNIPLSPGVAVNGSAQFPAP
jgi:expansin (peptidoglycan-binding protein)